MKAMLLPHETRNKEFAQEPGYRSLPCPHSLVGDFPGRVTPSSISPRGSRQSGRRSLRSQGLDLRSRRYLQHSRFVRDCQSRDADELCGLGRWWGVRWTCAKWIWDNSGRLGRQVGRCCSSVWFQGLHAPGLAKQKLVPDSTREPRSSLVPDKLTHPNSGNTHDDALTSEK